MRLSLFLLLACVVGCDPPAPSPDIVEQAQVITEVFETPEAYSVRRLDSLEVERFLLSNPEYHMDTSAIRSFYRRRHYQFAWFVNDSLSQSAAAFFNLVSSSDTSSRSAAGREMGNLKQRLSELMMSHSLRSENPIATDGDKPCDSCMHRLELDLTAQFFRFADRNYGGVVGKDLRELDWFIPRRKKNYERLLDSLVAGRMDLGPIEPVHPQYAQLKAGLKRYHDLDTLPWPAILIGEKRKLEPGDKNDAIIAIRQRLLLLGDMDGTGDSLQLASTTYDSTLVKAVERFQSRHGLHPDGVIGQGALKQLNVTPSERLRTMLVNMERLRWVQERTVPDLLLVNIPEFRLHVYEADTVAWSMVVVVGASATRTVIFSDTLSHIAFSPTWTVPQSIVRGEILPAIAKDPGYLRKKGMEIIGGSESRPVIRQKPGAGNALGRVKFLFPNSYSIYFHDTPSKGFFARESRAFSHGCIRLSEPQRFAEYLLRNDTAWTTDRIKEAMRSGKEKYVTLKEKRPVTIGYFTAWVDRQGQLNFRDDVYGHDARLANELFTASPPIL